MMPDPESICAYDIIGEGWLWRSAGRVDARVLPLGPNTVNFEITWKSRQSSVVRKIDCPFDVICSGNRFELMPCGSSGSEASAPTDESTKVVERMLKGLGLIAIAEHVTRSRLELWRVAALEGRPQEELEPLWDSYLEAETAITWTWPAIDWAFLINENQATELRMGL